MDEAIVAMVALLIAGGCAFWAIKDGAEISIHRNAYLDRCTKAAVYSECLSAWDRELSK